MTRHRTILLLFFWGACALRPAGAEPSRTAPGDLISPRPGRLKIAVFDRPPYTYKDRDGAWTGLSVELWDEIAGKLGLSYDFVEVPLREVSRKLHTGACDLCLALAISRETASQIEFTEPYLFSHGAVVTARRSMLDTLVSLHSYVWNKKMLLILFLMLLGMLLFSILLMLAERNHEKGHFSGPSVKGLGSALWFSAVTMTTVGYGDKTPLSPLGRFITFVWMLMGVLLIALFTGTVASSITTAEIHGGIMRLDDLTRFRVGCMEGSRIDLLLKSRGIPAVRYLKPEEGFEDYAKGEINACAGDSVTLEYLMTRNAPGKFQISIIPDAAMIYCFGARPGLPQLSEINRELLSTALASDWRSRVERWTGPLSY